MKTLPLVHLVRPPIIEAGTPPLLLLLHGIGSNEHDLYGLAPFLDKRFLIISVRAPNTLGPGSYAWFEIMFRSGLPPLINPQQAEASRKALLRFINEAVTAYGAEASQVYLMGFSQAKLPGNPGVLDARKRRRAGAAIVAADQNHIRVSFRYSGRDCSNANLGYQLHAYACLRVRVLQVVDQLSQILDRIDVVMGRGRDQSHAWG